MKKTLGKLLFCFCFLIFSACSEKKSSVDVDVLVVGGGASGVAAGIQSARLGVNTLIIVFRSVEQPKTTRNTQA